MDQARSQQSGQVLVLILLVSVVGLTIGLSIAGRSLQNVEQGAQTEEANRAFSAAEAGIEEALLDLQQSGSVDVSSIEGTDLTGGGRIKDISPNVLLPNSEANAMVVELKKDEVVQIALEDAGTYARQDVTVKWEADASLVLARIYEDGGGYGVQKYAYNSTGRTNGFGLWDPGDQVQIDPDDNGQDGVALRIRAMYADTKIRIWGSDLPAQGTQIDSTGQSGESERKVRVVRTLPALPAIFDYVLFSGGSITK